MTAIQHTSQPVKPEPIIGTMGGIMAAQYLMVANEVGIFEALADEELSLDELVARTELPERSVRIVSDALVALGYLEKGDGRYRNTPVTFTFLSGCTPADLRPYVRMAHRVEYARWGDFEDVVRAGGRAGVDVFQTPSEQQHILSEGIAAMTGPAAMQLAETYDFGRFNRLLDVGGGAGFHLQAVLDRYPDLGGTLFELQPVAALARYRLAAFVDAGRAEVVDGDIFDDPLPSGHDVVLLCHIIHLFTPDRIETLLRRIRDRVEAGAHLLLVDFWTNAERTEPTGAVLSAGIFYGISGGDVYSVEEAEAWLARTGWTVVGHRPLAGPQSLIEAEAA